jgi:hypothetical protein
MATQSYDYKNAGNTSQIPKGTNNFCSATILLKSPVSWSTCKPDSISKDGEDSGD